MNRFHDTIIVYSKTNNQIFNPIYFNYDDEYKKKSNVKFCDIHKKEYVTTAIYNAQPDVNPRMNLRYVWNGFDKQWYVTKDKMEKLHNENRLEYNVINCDNYLNENKSFFLEFIKLITREECKQFPIIFRNAQYIGGYKECMNEVYRICFDAEDNF